MEYTPDINSSESTLDVRQPDTENKKVLSILLVVVFFGFIAAVSGAIYLYSQLSMLRQQFTELQNTQTPSQLTGVSPVSPQTTELSMATGQVSDTADWNIFQDQVAGVSFKYPKTVSMKDANSQGGTDTTLNVFVTPLEQIQDFPLNFTKEIALKDKQSLMKGEYGQQGVGLALPQSEKIFSVAGSYGKTFVSLDGLEVCNVFFKRTAIFYYQDRQILLNFVGYDSLADASPAYFTTNPDYGCEAPVWKENGAILFYSDLLSKQAPMAAQEWYDTFDTILSTLTTI